VPRLSEEDRARRVAARARRDALAAEEDDHRRAERARRWARDGTWLSFDELRAGVACRGCGEPVVDGRGSWPPLMKLTGDERAAYDEAEAQFRQRHTDCRSGRWSVSGSRSWHCGFCCPPPPPSPKQIEQISRILSSTARDVRELDRWELTLTCDHTVALSQHRDHRSWSMSVVDCPECGIRRGVFRSVHVGPVPDAAERERLESDLAAARSAVDRHRRALARAEQRVAELTTSLARLDTTEASVGRHG